MLRHLINSYDNEKLPIKFSLGVEENNIFAVKCYESVGFVIINKKTIESGVIIYNMEFIKIK